MEVTKQNIAKLPRWAQVAFAARCARRVLVLVGPEAHKECSLAIDWAEYVSSHAPTPAALAAVSHAEATEAAEAANLAAERAPASSAPRSAARAASAAAHAVDAASANTIATLKAAQSAAAHAAAAAAAAGGLAGASASNLQTLKLLATKGSWNDDTPVPVELIDLWPNGEPEWYRVAYEEQQEELRKLGIKPESIEATMEVNQEEIPHELVLRFGLPDPNLYDPVDGAAAIKEFLEALSEWNIAIGGSGLSISEGDIFVPVYHEVEAPA